jgi:hypothetical protein
LIAPASPSITLWLSVLLGAYLLAGGMAALLRGGLWLEMIAEFERSPGLVMISGAIAFAVGSLIVSVHNQWTSPGAFIVSATGWMALAEGLTLIAAPQLWLRLARPVMRNARIWGFVMLVLGAFLLSSAITRPLVHSVQ